jgi:hypothetical protein
MNPTTDDVKRALAAASRLVSEGYFAKVKTGDERAASYFSRMVAARANPDGIKSDWGALRKTAGGFNVEGYADGAIVFGNNPSDLRNVLKIVTQVGSDNPNAIQIGDQVQERRPVDVWESPVPLPSSLGTYLLNGGVPLPPPPVVPPPPAFTIDRAEFIEEGFALHQTYQDQLKRPEGLWKPEPRYPNGAPDFEGIGAWLFDVYLSERMKGASRADARAAYIRQIRNSDEWRQKHPGETP